MTRIFADDGTGTVAVPIKPEHVKLLPIEALVDRHMPALIRTCREIGARPIAGQEPQVLSEREMAQVDDGAVRWRPGMVWLAVPVIRDDGESLTVERDLSPD